MAEAHEFEIDVELHAKLEEAFRILPPRQRSLLVHENENLMKDAGFDIPGGEGTREELLEVTSDRVQCPSTPVESPSPPRYAVTKVCTSNCDTLTAALVVGEALALNFANAYTPGGHYLNGASAQEEDLCRLLPQLYPALQACKYPIDEDEVIVTHNLKAVRRPNSYELVKSMGTCSLLTAAMPHGFPGCEEDPEWLETVTLRMRAVLHAAKRSGMSNLVLGAWGCGMFGNPPDAVARMFWAQLGSPEYRGYFENVVFAIIGAERTRAAFAREMNVWCEKEL
eukprot:TRINITY_DN31300_c0_g1_i2.p1 TRINITY_DN31300_c0_g1~~TRINITY_DN31300_c0_g1_i2.p1  ORF type:complete len:307 (-),score=30.80 TRINITY_DN31300_c0_g1_i2:331-1176(-)